MVLNIERLTNVPARSAWNDEARDFTPWLASNLDRLEEAIGIKLELEGQEVSVDRYYADILATDPVNDRKVLIENQLERADHRHLGQLMTYLAGLDAEVVVWIATGFTDSHLAALKWLNEHTVDPFAFFAVQIRLVKIGNSEPALVLDVMERPNNWERSIQKASKGTREKTERALFRESYWERFLETYPEAKGWGIVKNGSPSQWIKVPSCDGVFLSIYLAIGEVGVFLRGARGVPAAQFNQRFSPMRQEFADLIGHDFERGQEGSDSHPVCHVPMDTYDEEMRDIAIDWHVSKIRLWLHAAEAVFGSDE